MRYLGKVRIQNAAPKSIPQFNLNHAWSGNIIAETEKVVTVKIDSVLDPADNGYYNHQFQLTIPQLLTMSHNFVKLVP